MSAHDIDITADDGERVIRILGTYVSSRAQREPKLIVLTGAPATGKTLFARAWVAEDPDRRRAGSGRDARLLVDQGFDVVLDLEGGMQLSRHVVDLQGLSFEVRHFECDPNFNQRSNA